MLIPFSYTASVQKSTVFFFSLNVSRVHEYHIATCPVLSVCPPPLSSFFFVVVYLLWTAWSSSLLAFFLSLYLSVSVVLRWVDCVVPPPCACVAIGDKGHHFNLNNQSIHHPSMITRIHFTKPLFFAKIENRRREDVAYTYTIRIRYLYLSARACSRTTHSMAIRNHTHGGYRWIDVWAGSGRHPFSIQKHHRGCSILNDRVNEKQTTIQSISHSCTKKNNNKAPSAERSEPVK